MFTDLDPPGFVETLIDCQSLRDESFWRNFLSTGQTFVRVSGVILRSPLCHGNVNLTMSILQGLEQVRVMARQMVSRPF